jgi:predicted NAD/FAD-dependent oxidoreductase
MNFKYVDVAIIGAGLAGVAAAGDLIAAGKSVLLIDKSRGVGGRMATRRHCDTRIDHGAQFFTARSARFQSIIGDLLRSDVVKIWSHGFPVLLDGVVVPRPDGHPRYACPGGMSELAKALLPAGAEILTSTEVTSVLPLQDGPVNGARYEVLCGGSTICLARDVVLNMPPVQLLQVAAAVLGDDDIARLGAVTMEPCWAMGGCLSQDILLDAVALECQHDVLGWISRNHTRRSAANEPVSVMVHASGAWSAAHLEDEKSDVRVALELAMSEIGLSLSWDGEPFIHRWRYAKPGIGLNADCFASTRSQGIYGVGDWCQGGRVEGAICSGWSVAERL